MKSPSEGKKIISEVPRNESQSPLTKKKRFSKTISRPSEAKDDGSDTDENIENPPKERNLSKNIETFTGIRVSDDSESENDYAEIDNYPTDDTYDDVMSEEEDEINSEIAELSNLTPVQLQMLVNDKEKEIKECKKQIAVMRMDTELLENEECEVFRSSDTEKYLRFKRKQLQEEEICLQKFKERASTLKSVKTKYQPFPVSELPQVILCSPWNDNLMPKIAVCSRPKAPVKETNKLNDEFLKCFSPEQLEMIEREKQWMELECGQMQLQIAGVRGKLRVVSRENNLLKAIVHEEPTDARQQAVIPPENALPCQRKKGISQQTKPCPKFQKQAEEPNEVPTMAITIASSAINVPPDQALPFEGDVREELSDIEKKVEELQAALEKAKLKAGTIKAQQDALACAKNALK